MTSWFKWYWREKRTRSWCMRLSISTSHHEIRSQMPRGSWRPAPFQMTCCSWERVINLRAASTSQRIRIIRSSMHSSWTWECRFFTLSAQSELYKQASLKTIQVSSSSINTSELSSKRSKRMHKLFMQKDTNLHMRSTTSSYRSTITGASTSLPWLNTFTCALIQKLLASEGCQRKVEVVCAIRCSVCTLMSSWVFPYIFTSLVPCLHSWIAA